MSTSITELQRMHIAAIIASIPRQPLQEFKNSISNLSDEEKAYLKIELDFKVTRGGGAAYKAALNSL